MAKTFFTIDGVQPEVPPHDPDVIKFYDRASAQVFLTLWRGIVIDPEKMNGWFVAEHDTSILNESLDVQPPPSLPPPQTPLRRG